jgi:hypothetical protein
MEDCFEAVFDFKWGLREFGIIDRLSMRPFCYLFLIWLLFREKRGQN